MLLSRLFAVSKEVLFWCLMTSTSSTVLPQNYLLWVEAKSKDSRVNSRNMWKNCWTISETAYLYEKCFQKTPVTPINIDQTETARPWSTISVSVDYGLDCWMSNSWKRSGTQRGWIQVLLRRNGYWSTSRRRSWSLWFFGIVWQDGMGRSNSEEATRICLGSLGFFFEPTLGENDWQNERQVEKTSSWCLCQEKVHLKVFQNTHQTFKREIRTLEWLAW